MVAVPTLTPLLAEAMPKARSEQEPLPEGYYVDNFQTVLDTVVERYHDLLHPAERDFASDFSCLSVDARRLYVRLISRKGPTFRRDRLSYREIGDLDAAIDELADRGFLDPAPAASAAELLGLLLRPELQGLLAELRPSLRCTSWRKNECVEALVAIFEHFEWRPVLARRWRFLEPLHLDHLLIYRLLFFGNLSQDWTAFVLHDLGVVRFEAYELRRELRLFPSRRALDDSLALRCYRQLAHELLHQGDLDAALEIARAVLGRVEPWEPSALPLRDRLFNKIGRALERCGELDQALHFYGLSNRPPARERRARILDRLERCNEALSLCAEIEREALDETERIFAPRFAHRLRRRLGQERRPWPRVRRPVRELGVEPRAETAVEALALEALAAAGQPGFFAENWLWKTLFGLHFWDVIFAPVGGAFQHPFQFGPLDLHSADFYRARRPMIDRRLDEIRAGDWPPERLLDLYRRKQDTANAFVVWHQGLALEPCLELALERLSGEQLAWICDRLSRDPGRYRRGLPDLFVLRDAEQPGFELLEVKGPGDQLRPEQKSWIDYLNDGGLPAAVLKVRFETV